MRALRNLGRVTHIGLTLARYDALIGIERLGLPRAVIAALARLRRSGLDPRPGVRLAAALTELGPSFVKLGQALSTRADLVGEEVAADLSELQDKLAPLHINLFVETSPAPVKYALSLLGKCANTLRLPMVPTSVKAQTAVREAMVHAGLVN